MIKRLIRKYLLAVQLLLVLTGVVLVLSSAVIPKGTELSQALFGLGTAVISSTLVSMLHSAFGTDIPSLVEQKLGFNRQVYDLGLEAIHLRVGDESIFDRFERARTIDMMYNTAKNACTRYVNRIEHAIISHGCKVRIVISDPDNTIWSNKEVALGLCPGTDILSEIRDVISHLKFIVSELEQHRPPLKAGSLELRVFPCLPTCSIVIVNGETARYTPYLPYAHSATVPNYDATKERGGQLFDHLQRTFDQVWMHSRPVLKKDFSHPRRS